MIKSGVMEATYAADRKRKPGHIFNLNMRVQVVLHCIYVYHIRTSGLKILDLGSAEGSTLIKLDRDLKNCRFWGVEYSDDLIKAGEKLPASITLLQGDVSSLPSAITCRNYDIVTALAVLEHLSNPVDAIKCAATTLKKGGVFIATAPAPFWDTLASKLDFIPGEHHIRYVNVSTLRSLVIEAGLRPLATIPFMFAPVACLPYFGIPIKPKKMLQADLALSSLRFLYLFFANMAIVAVKD